MESPPAESVSVVDVTLGASSLAVGVTAYAAERLGSVLEPAARLLLRPPLLPQRLQPARLLVGLGRSGAERSVAIRRDLVGLLDALVPLVLREVLQRVDLTETVIRYVDLDRVVATVDLDVAVSRVDIDAAAKGLDLDAVAGRLDVDAVAGRLDIESIIARLDLTGIVLEHVDLDAIIQAALARIDLVGLAEEVIDAIDLPEIIRESTGTMASDTVHGARMQGIAADAAVGRAVDRLLLRRGRRTTAAVDTELPVGGPDIPAQKERSGADLP